MNEESPIHERNGNTVPLREYIETIIAEKDRALQAAFIAQQNALTLAAKNLELRLEKLNEMRQEVTQDRASYQTRDRAEAMFDAVEARLGALENWRSRATGAAVVLGLFAGAIGAVITKTLGG